MIRNKKITTIEEYLVHLSENNEKLIGEIRKLLKETYPEIVEKIMWSTPWYDLRGAKFIWLMSYNDHVNFGFAYGAHLKSDLLEGTGKNMRHIKIKGIDDFNSKKLEIVELLHKAAGLKI